MAKLATVIVPAPLVAQARREIGRLYLGSTATDEECSIRGSGYFSVPVKKNPNAQITHYMSVGYFEDIEYEVLINECPLVHSIMDTDDWQSVLGTDYVAVLGEDNES